VNRRARVRKNLVAALQEDFARHGRGAVSDLRHCDPVTYFRVLLTVLPQRLDGGGCDPWAAFPDEYCHLPHEEHAP
jgi:hypothetical protein